MTNRGDLTGLKSGEEILESLVARGANQWNANAAYQGQKFGAYVDLLTLPADDGKVDFEKLKEVARRLMGTSAPAGDIIEWEPPDTPTPIRRKTKRTRTA
jgi:hypothetical protein